MFEWISEERLALARESSVSRMKYVMTSSIPDYHSYTLPKMLSLVISHVLVHISHATCIRRQKCFGDLEGSFSWRLMLWGGDGEACSATG